MERRTSAWVGTPKSAPSALRSTRSPTPARFPPCSCTTSDHLRHRAARRHHVFDDERPLAGRIVNPRRSSILSPAALGEDRPGPSALATSCARRIPPTAGDRRPLGRRRPETSPPTPCRGASVPVRAAGAVRTSRSTSRYGSPRSGGNALRAAPPTSYDLHDLLLIHPAPLSSRRAPIPCPCASPDQIAVGGHTPRLRCSSIPSHHSTAAVGWVKLAVPTATALAPAKENSSASRPDAIPPIADDRYLYRLVDVPDDPDRQGADRRPRQSAHSTGQDGPLPLDVDRHAQERVHGG